MRWLFALAGVPLFLLLLIPVLALGQRFSLHTFLAQLSERNTRFAIWLSFVTSTLTTLLVLVMGTPLATVLARRRGCYVRILELMVDLPTIFPPAVAGLALLIAFSPHGFIGKWLDAMGIDVVFTPAAVVIAQMFVAAPFYIKTATVGLEAVHPELVQAAALDGADWFQTLRYIRLPLAWRAMITGTILCWARALGEFGATIMLAGNTPGRTQTMTLAVYLAFQSDMDEAITLALILLGTSCAVLLVARAFLGSRLPEDL